MTKQPCAVHRALLSISGRTLIIALLGIVGLQLVAPAAWADEWIVDDSNPAVHFNGTWDRTTTTAGFYGTDYLIHAPGNGGATLHWAFPSAGTSGRYAVYVRYTSGPNRASAAMYHVTARNASADVAVNQKIGGGTWHKLGTFTFDPKQGQEVGLSGESDGVVVGDAVAWVGPLDADASDDVVDLSSVQAAVNSGDQPWRLDPVAVVHAQAATLGLSSSDPVRLMRQGDGEAVVRAEHASHSYDIQLSQPAGAGAHGIWVVDSMRRTTLPSMSTLGASGS